MPKYKYKCDQCSTIFYKTVSYNKSHDLFPCECGGIFHKTLSLGSEPTVMVRVDRVKNIQQRDKLNKRMKARAKKFFMENKLDQYITKIGTAKAKELGLIKKNGKRITEEDLK